MAERLSRETIEGMCENIIGLHSGYTRERCEALRDLALQALSSRSAALEEAARVCDEEVEEHLAQQSNAERSLLGKQVAAALGISAKNLAARIRALTPQLPKEK